MKKRKRILVAAVVVAVAGGLAWVVLREPPEPVYKGRRLSAWYQDTLEERSKSIWSSATRNYGEALGYTGTNAFPFLLVLLDSKGYSPLRTKLAEWANLHSKIFHHHFWTESDRIGFEIGVFYSLAESEPKPPVSWFLEILDKSKNINAKVRILYAVSLVDDPETVRPVIVKALTDDDSHVRKAATDALKRIDLLAPYKARVQ